MSTIGIKKNRIIYIICFFLLIAVDQFSKYLVRLHLIEGVDEITVLPKVLVFTFVKNTGVVFGMFQGNVGIISIISVLVLVIVCWYYFHMEKTKKMRPVTIILLFITAGACGNIIDRFILGYVTDFIYIKIIDFAVFNIADMYITVSSFILFIYLLFCSEEDIGSLSLRKKSKKGIEEENGKNESAESNESMD